MDVFQRRKGYSKSYALQAPNHKYCRSKMRDPLQSCFSSILILSFRERSPVYIMMFQSVLSRVGQSPSRPSSPSFTAPREFPASNRIFFAKIAEAHCMIAINDDVLGCDKRVEACLMHRSAPLRAHERENDRVNHGAALSRSMNGCRTCLYRALLAKHFIRLSRGRQSVRLCGLEVNPPSSPVSRQAKE